MQFQRSCLSTGCCHVFQKSACMPVDARRPPPSVTFDAARGCTGHVTSMRSCITATGCVVGHAPFALA